MLGMALGPPGLMADTDNRVVAALYNMGVPVLAQRRLTNNVRARLQVAAIYFTQQLRPLT